MNENTIRQLIDAANNNNGFAITLLGTLLVNCKEEISIKTGKEKIVYAGDGKNVLWAKNLKSYIYSTNPLVFPIHHHALLDSDAREQLENYVAEDDFWAMTILGDLLYQGRVVPQDQDTAEILLGRAANLGCLYARELVDAYNLSTARAIATDILKKYKTTDNKKFWMLK